MLALKPFSPQWFDKKLKKQIEPYAYEDSKYVGCFVWGLYGVGERMPKDAFEKEGETVSFEGYEFPVFGCWDMYLTGLYGDYMTPPPEDKRQTHDMVAYIQE